MHPSAGDSISANGIVVHMAVACQSRARNPDMVPAFDIAHRHCVGIDIFRT